MKKSFEQTLKQNKGVAGLEILKALMVGILVVVFVAFLIILISDKMMAQEGTSRTGAITVLGEFVGRVNSTRTTNLSVFQYPGVDCTITAAKNSSNSVLIPASNYTSATECTLKSVVTAKTKFANRNWTINFTYAYDKQNKVGELFNETIVQVSDNTTSNLGLWLFLAAMIVVVILVSISLIYLNRIGGGGQGGSQIFGTSEGA